MNRWLSMILVAFAVLVAGCGGGGDESAAAADSAASTDPAGPVTASGRDSGAIDATPTSSGDTDTTNGAAGGDSNAATDGAVVGQGPPFEAPVRNDGLLLVFGGGTLGPIGLGSTPDELVAALGPEFRISPVETIRSGFPSGYSVSWQGEVLFWAIEDDGELDLFMTNNPRVGLESGLRPRLPLADAIEIHGEPVLELGAEQREFASFSDGTGNDDAVAVLVAIGEFGGPVGLYEAPGGQSLEQAEGYVLDDANVKELWFGTLPG